MRPKTGRKPGSGLYPRQARIVLTDEMYLALNARCDAEGISLCEALRRGAALYLDTAWAGVLEEV
jgi:hypothetical protein